MNAIKMLTTQHRELEAALKNALAAQGAERRRLFEACADVLRSHVLVEERQFYPAVKAKRTEDILLESLEEHLSLKRLVADLLPLRATDEHFEPKSHVLAEQLEHHHKEEEDDLFPKAKKLLPAEELDLLGEAMEVAQAELLAQCPREFAADQKTKAADLR